MSITLKGEFLCFNIEGEGSLYLPINSFNRRFSITHASVYNHPDRSYIHICNDDSNRYTLECNSQDALKIVAAFTKQFGEILEDPTFIRRVANKVSYQQVVATSMQLEDKLRDVNRDLHGLVDGIPGVEVYVRELVKKILSEHN